MPKSNLMDVLEEIDQKISEHIEKFEAQQKLWKEKAETALAGNDVAAAKDRIFWSEQNANIVKGLNMAHIIVLETKIYERPNNS